MILEALTLSMLLTTSPTAAPMPRSPDAIVEAALKKKGHSNSTRVGPGRKPPRAPKPRSRG